MGNPRLGVSESIPQGEVPPWSNEHYPFRVESTYQALPEGRDLDLVFSLRHSRKAREDNTIS